MAIWEDKDGKPDKLYIAMMCCVFSCCLLGQCGDGSGGSNRNPLADSEAEWQRLSTQEKADRIEREMRRQGAR
tara:strand:- start:1818 stop:2036 length:219 start_codon:yes stop_codon:yes gene_type:complete